MVVEEMQTPSLSALPSRQVTKQEMIPVLPNPNPQKGPKKTKAQPGGLCEAKRSAVLVQGEFLGCGSVDEKWERRVILVLNVMQKLRALTVP